MGEAKRANPQVEYYVRQTDNTLKEGDKVSPQTNEPLELDANGLPVGFSEWRDYDGN
jgi:hypothetical protein